MYSGPAVCSGSVAVLESTCTASAEPMPRLSPRTSDPVFQSSNALIMTARNEISDDWMFCTVAAHQRA